jgi:hypothetical protein
MVFKRLVDLGEKTEKFPERAYESSTGRKWKKAQLLDFNRLVIAY